MVRLRRGLSFVLSLALLFVLAFSWLAPPAAVLARSGDAVPPATTAVVAGPADPRMVVGTRPTREGVIFELDGRAAQGATELILWYDTAVGRQGVRFPTRSGASLRQAVPVSFVRQGLAVSMPFSGRLDYWWATSGPDGVLQRRAGSVALPPALRKLATPAAPTLPEPFTWSEAATEHFRIRFYPGSAAERDIDLIKAEAEQALVTASRIISPTESVSITTYLVPRLFWQGGAAFDGSTLLISYLDRNYAGIELPLYLVHEATHALAHGLVEEGGQVGGLIGEGVAVYATGGHYGVEPLDEWAATLARSDRYVPLCRLRATFFQQQREIAYLEGGSFVGYLIRTYGLDAFRRFYATDPALPRDVEQDVEGFCAQEATRPVAGIGKTYTELEAGWLAYLNTLEPTPTQRDGLWAQIRFFELMRHYQEQRDTPARILPPPPARWPRELVPAFATPAVTETNTIHEALLVAAEDALESGQPAEANALMDEIEVSVATTVFTGTVGREYAAITSVLGRFARAQRLGDAQRYRGVVLPEAGAFENRLWSDYRLVLNRIDLDGEQARAYVEQVRAPIGGPPERTLMVVTLQRRPSGWRITTLQPD